MEIIYDYMLIFSVMSSQVQFSFCGCPSEERPVSYAGVYEMQEMPSQTLLCDLLNSLSFIVLIR